MASRWSGGCFHNRVDGVEAASTTVTNNAPTGVSASAQVSRVRAVAGNAVMDNMGARGDSSHLTRNDDRKYNVLVYGLEECVLVVNYYACITGQLMPI